MMWRNIWVPNNRYENRNAHYNHKPLQTVELHHPPFVVHPAVPSNSEMAIQSPMLIRQAQGRRPAPRELKRRTFSIVALALRPDGKRTVKSAKPQKRAAVENLEIRLCGTCLLRLGCSGEEVATAREISDSATERDTAVRHRTRRLKDLAFRPTLLRTLRPTRRKW